MLVVNFGSKVRLTTFLLVFFFYSSCYFNFSTFEGLGTGELSPFFSSTVEHQQ